MYYQKQNIIVKENVIIDLKTGQQFEFDIKRKVMNCFPSGTEVVKNNFSEGELRKRRCEIAAFLKSIKKVRKVIYSFI